MAAGAALICASMVFVGVASAQLPADPKANPPTPARPPATAQQNPTTPPERVAPPSPNIGKSLRGAETGVLHPRENVDPGIQRATPNPREFPMPVVPPGGTKTPTVPK